jgi:HK97 gp10 family phage protein
MAEGRRKKAGTIGFDIFSSVDLSSVLTRVEDALEEAVERSAELALNEAKGLAPVRRVVKGDRRGKTRRLTIAERKSEAGIRRKLGINVGTAQIQTQAEDRRNRSVPSNPFLRARSKRPFRSPPPEVRVAGRGFAAKAGANLSSRGVWELKSGRAVYRTTAGRLTLGGRLRGDLKVEQESGPPIVKYWLGSPTPYAKYVEFGTRRSRAQPFLRPALALVRRQFHDIIRTELNKLNWKPKRKHTRTRF